MSSAQITEDEVGKPVVDENGEQVGVVSAVEHGAARVDPDPGITDKIKAKLGWEDADEDTYPLQEGMVERVTDDEIRLRSDR
jgi:hypothetical protein